MGKNGGKRKTYRVTWGSKLIKGAAVKEFFDRKNFECQLGCRFNEWRDDGPALKTRGKKLYEGG